MDTNEVLRMRVYLGNDVPDLFHRLAKSKRPGRVLVSLALRGLQAELESHSRLLSFGEGGVMRESDFKGPVMPSNVAMASSSQLPASAKADDAEKTGYGEIMELDDEFFKTQ